jgi:hypothetical protein
MSRKSQEKTSKITQAFVDESVRLADRIREDQRRMAEIRDRLKEAGRPDLARKFLQTPMELDDLAGFLWRSEALVVFGRNTEEQDRNAKPPVTEYQKRLTLEYSKRSEENPAPRSPSLHHADLERFAESVTSMFLAKIMSELRARYRRVRMMDEKSILREALIKCAPLYDLVEWACIFPDALAAGDCDFVTKIISSHDGNSPAGVLRGHYRTIAKYWSGEGFDSLGLAGKVPALKYWSDRAASAFIGFIEGRPLRVTNYQQCKSRLGLHSEKPTLVTGARYSCEGDTHRLKCWHR